jgi:hypothetical protein
MTLAALEFMSTASLIAQAEFRGRLAGMQEAAAIAAGQPGRDGYRFGHDGEAWHQESAYGSGRATAAAAIRARIAEKERTSPRKP